MHFGEKIKILREKKLLTRRQLADSLGIKYSTLSNYENGVRQPDFDTLKLIAKYFSVSIDYLLEDNIEDDPYTSHEAGSVGTEDIKLLIKESQQISKDDLQFIINLLQRMNKNKN